MLVRRSHADVAAGPVVPDAPFDAAAYWEERYRAGGTSGVGSCGVLAQYKADVVNRFVAEHDVKTVIEFGCGDGTQLGLMNYPQYLGLDVAPSAVALCRAAFRADDTKRFLLYEPGVLRGRGDPGADLTVCLDVLYHIIDDALFAATLDDFFCASRRHAIVYANLNAAQPPSVPHIVWRPTLAHLAARRDFLIERVLPQPYPQLSAANFIFLRRRTDG